MYFNDNVPHNKISHDGKGIRKWRLQHIQNDHIEVKGMLTLPIPLGQWMGVCFDEFEAASYGVTAGRFKKQDHTAIMVRSAKGLRQQYVELKGVIATHYREFPVLLSEFDLHLPLPRGAAATVERVRAVKNRLEYHATLPDAPHIRPEAVTRLAELLAKYDTAAEAARPEAEVARKHAQQHYDALWERDTQFLNQLLALWSAFSPERDKDYMWKKVGFRMPQPRRAGMPQPPENLRVENKRLVWDAAERATSYQVHIRPAGKGKRKFTEHYAGNKTACPAPQGGYTARVRARNVHGFGRFGEEITVEG